MLVELCKFIKSTHNRWTLWYMNYTSIKMFGEKKNFISFKASETKRIIRPFVIMEILVSSHLFGSRTSRNSPANSVRTALILPASCPRQLFGQKSSRKSDIAMHFPAQELPSSALHVPQAWGLELWYFLQHFFPLFPIFLASALWPASSFLCSWPQFLLIIIAPPSLLIIMFPPAQPSKLILTSDCFLYLSCFINFYIL